MTGAAVRSAAAHATAAAHRATKTEMKKTTIEELNKLANEHLESALCESVIGFRCRRCGEVFLRQHPFAEHAARCLETAERTAPTKQPWRQLQTHMRHTQFVDAEMVRQRGVVGRLGQTTFKFADDAAFNARMQCAWFRACVAPGSTAMSSTCACGTEGGCLDLTSTFVHTLTAAAPAPLPELLITTHGAGRHRSSPQCNQPQHCNLPSTPSRVAITPFARRCAGDRPRAHLQLEPQPRKRAAQGARRRRAGPHEQAVMTCAPEQAAES